MNTLWSMLFNFWFYLPWAVIGLMAGMAWRHRRDSKVLLMQALGAIAYFVIGFIQWVVVSLILVGMGAGGGVIFAANVIFGFLMFVALALFAVGYCIERFRRRKADAMAVEVKATPAD